MTRVLYGPRLGREGKLIEAQAIGGTLSVSNETTALGNFKLDELQGMQMLGRQEERDFDTLEKHVEALIK